MGKTVQKQQNKRKIPVKLISGTVVVFVLVIAVMTIEAKNTEKLVIKNNSAVDIESISLYFEDTEEEDYDILPRDAAVSVAAGEKYTGKYTAQPGLNPYGSFLMIRVKFAGREEVQTYAGYFTRTFTGKIKIEFMDSETDDNILMKIKAGDGLFQSTKFTDCDEVQELFELE